MVYFLSDPFHLLFGGGLPSDICSESAQLLPAAWKAFLLPKQRGQLDRLRRRRHFTHPHLYSLLPETLPSSEILW